MNSLGRRTARGRREGVRFAWVMAGLAAASLSAKAQQFSVGVGAGVDRGKTDCVATCACDRGSAFAKLVGGYRFANGVDCRRWRSMRVASTARTCAVPAIRKASRPTCGSWPRIRPRTSQT